MNCCWRFPYGKADARYAELHCLSVRVRNTRIHPFLEYDSSAADILSGRPERVSAKKGPPPSHCGLKFWLVTTLRATRSLWSLKQALRLTPPAKISPFGHRPPFKWAGSCTSAYVLVFRRRGFTHIAKCFCSFRAGSNAVLAVKYAGADPHPSRSFTACPWKICVAASRLPCLLCLYAGGAETGAYFPFLSCSWNFCVARFCVHPLYYTFLFHKVADLHHDEYLFRRMWVRFLYLRYVSKGEPPKARHKTMREYR